MRVAVLLLFASFAARAWDPTDAASVDARVQELHAAWSGQSPMAVANDKLKRARQTAKPAWVSRQAFRIDDGARRLYLGVNDDYLNDNAGQYTALGELTLVSGAHLVELRYGASVLGPGSGGPEYGLGPLVISPSGPAC